MSANDRIKAARASANKRSPKTIAFERLGFSFRPFAGESNMRS